MHPWAQKITTRKQQCYFQDRFSIQVWSDRALSRDANSCLLQKPSGISISDVFRGRRWTRLQPHERPPHFDRQI